MNRSSVIERLFRSLLPAPLTIALLLTLVSMLLAWVFTGADLGTVDRVGNILSQWEHGLWNPPLLVFAVQMMLMLVLGHVLALSAPVARFIGWGTRFCTDTASAAALVTLLSVLVALFNWGLGLVFGAILARKVGEQARQRGTRLNYPLIGASGYAGMMVWHGGISGSAPIKAAEAGHLHELLSASVSTEALASYPQVISFSETVFGPMNLLVTLLLILILPAFMFMLGRRSDRKTELPEVTELEVSGSTGQALRAAERLDASRWFTFAVGMAMVTYCAVTAVVRFADAGLGFITPDFINLLLLGLGLFFHSSINGFLRALNDAITGASGILIQFPLYFGIMGIMSGSGLAHMLADFFVDISSQWSFPLYTMVSAGIVNVFVPSGGGQWGIQGPVILKAAMQLGVDIPKCIMALAYGDQLTNMLQPFWALPLLGITGLKAREILPYTLALMLPGAIIFAAVLMFY